MVYGAGGGTRTPDLGIMIPVLYRLSYTGTFSVKKLSIDCKVYYISPQKAI